MANDQANKTYTEVNRLLKDNKLKKAFSVLSSNPHLNTDSKLRDLLNNLEETYKYLIHYLVEGFEDESRDKMLSDIKSSLYFVNDAVRRNMIVADSSDIYSSTLRMEKVRKSTLRSRISEYRKAESMASLAKEAGGYVELQREADNSLSALFAHVWTSFGASSDDYRSIRDFMKDGDVSFNAKAQMISALMLGNMSFYDKNGLGCLIDIFESDLEPRIAARALVGIILVVASHPERVADDRMLNYRLSLWNDSIIIYRQLREVVMGIIRAHDTERISHKMRNEVIPELMKLRPEIIDKLRSSPEMADIESLEMNPEWEDLLNKNGIGDKLKELTEIQMEGGDVMMTAFSNLKAFPFFNNPANWFLPYFPDHSDIASQSTGSNAMFRELLDMEGVMCDSDKYSFALSLSRMPEEQSKLLAARMGEQMEQFKEVMANRKMKSTVPEFDTEVTRYVRDLYRFFKLFRRRNEFADPFEKPLDFGSLPYISDVLADNEILSLVGEFYFKRGYFNEALPILLKLEKEDSGNTQVWEKIGYCYHSLKDYKSALAWYKKAELVNPESQWLISSMATCFSRLNRFADASEYFQKALEKTPEDKRLLELTAYCQIKSGEIDKALANFYHSEYVSPQRISTWRGIAWSELLKKNLDKSLDYCNKILSHEKCCGNDLLNTGHVHYLLGNKKEAVECYKRAALFNEYGIEALEKDMTEDISTITSLGGKEKELLLLLEKVKYDLDL